MWENPGTPQAPGKGSFPLVTEHACTPSSRLNQTLAQHAHKRAICDNRYLAGWQITAADGRTCWGREVYASVRIRFHYPVESREGHCIQILVLCVVVRMIPTPSAAAKLRLTSGERLAAAGVRRIALTEHTTVSCDTAEGREKSDSRSQSCHGRV